MLKNFTRLTLALMLAMFIAPSSVMSADEPAAPPDDLNAEEQALYETVYDAFVWGYAMIAGDRVRRATYLAPPDGVPTPTNEMRYYDRLFDYRDRLYPTPNSDTLYSIAPLDLREGPAELEFTIKDDQYHSYQILDAYSQTVEWIGLRQQGPSQGRYWIVGPEYDGKTPSGVTLVELPTNVAWIIGRTFAPDPANLEDAIARQRAVEFRIVEGVQTESASADVSLPATLAPPFNIAAGGLSAFDELGVLIKINQPAGQARGKLQRFRAAGIGADLTTSEIITEPDTVALYERAMKDAQAVIDERAATSPTGARGWTYARVGVYAGDDDLLRAVTARRQIGAITPDEGVYFYLAQTPDGDRYRGEEPVTLRISPKDMPEIRGFWSVSAYGADDFYFAQNEIDRYTINHATPGVLREDDGTTEIILSSERPADAASNWLPTPTGPYIVMFRAFIPTADGPAYLEALPLPKPVVRANTEIKAQ